MQETEGLSEIFVQIGASCFIFIIFQIRSELYEFYEYEKYAVTVHFQLTNCPANFYITVRKDCPGNKCRSFMSSMFVRLLFCFVGAVLRRGGIGPALLKCLSGQEEDTNYEKTVPFAGLHPIPLLPKPRLLHRRKLQPQRLLSPAPHRPRLLQTHRISRSVPSSSAMMQSPMTRLIRTASRPVQRQTASTPTISSS